MNIDGSNKRLAAEMAFCAPDSPQDRPAYPGKPISRQEARKLLERLLERVRATDAAWDAFTAQTGADTDSPIGRAMFYQQSDLISLTAQILGDQSDWLNWYIYDNNQGKSGLPAGHVEDLRPIRTPDDLLDLLGYPKEPA